MDIAELASHIDHTVLAPDAQRADIERACQVALKWDVQQSVSTRSTSP